MLVDGSVGRAAVPSGASTGAHEAVELRDGDKDRYGGKGVLTRRSQRHRPYRAGARSGSTRRIRSASTRSLVELDGTPNKGELGANAILGVSLAVAHAAAAAYDLPLYRYLGGVGRADPAGPDVQHPQRRQARPGLDRLPGIHGDAGRRRRPTATRFAPAPRSSPRCARSSTTRATRPDRVTRAASRRRSPRTRRRSRSSCARSSERATGQARTSRSRSIRPRPSSSRTGPAATDTVRYVLAKEGRTLDERRARRPVGRWDVALSDRLDRGWPGRGRLARAGGELTERLGDRVQLVGDDLLVTNTTRIARAIDARAANAVLIKLNQIGTLTETIEAIELARASRLGSGRVASLRRDRGHDHRRPRRRDGHRPDQDRRPVAFGARGEVQPTAPDRGRARRRRARYLGRGAALVAGRDAGSSIAGPMIAAYVGIGMAVTIAVSFMLDHPDRADHLAADGAVGTADRLLREPAFGSARGAMVADPRNGAVCRRRDGPRVRWPDPAAQGDVLLRRQRVPDSTARSVGQARADLLDRRRLRLRALRGARPRA